MVAMDDHHHNSMAIAYMWSKYNVEKMGNKASHLISDCGVCSELRLLALSLSSMALQMYNLDIFPTYVHVEKI